MRTVYLVGCGAKKREEASAASELYTGHLFKLASAYAKSQTPDWYILSAKHGLVYPHTSLLPYEQRMSTSRYYAGLWAKRVVEKLIVVENLCAGGVQLVALAGEDYCRPLRLLLGERYGIALECPMGKLGIGQRLQWLAQRVPS